MEQFLSYFQFGIIEIIILSILGVLFLIQIFYYCLFYNKPRLYYKKSITQTGDKQDQKLPSVSVIIIATDEYNNLEQCLPVVLNQEYPDYEVIVVNNGLTDETDMLLKGLKLKYSHLYDTFLPKHSDTEASRKKLASTIGIKAAKKDILLFTEADTIPAGNKWIASMMQQMEEDKDVVLGYCLFNKSKRFINRIARFDNLLYSLQYLSSAIKRKPFTGTSRNVAYRKELFFDNKGFSLFLNYEYSEGIFLNYIMNKRNTAVSLSPDSFVSTNLNSISKWKSIKNYQNKIKKYFRNFRFFSNIFSGETISRYLFYILSVSSITYSIVEEKWGLLIIVGLLFIIKMITSLYIINKSASFFSAGKFRFSFIIIDLLQPIYNFIFRLRSR